MLSFPIFDVTFDVHTDERYYQLVGVVLKYKKPVMFIFSKLTNTQKRYYTTDKELIIIVYTLK